jgi:hypothetical protein
MKKRKEKGGWLSTNIYIYMFLFVSDLAVAILAVRA